MIDISNVYTGNWGAAIRGIRNPMNSWDRSDSHWKERHQDCCICSLEDEYTTPFRYNYNLGLNDLALAKKLVKAGTDHSKFMRMIIFSCDITAPLYWWKEMDTYKVGTVKNSCSTMHRIMEKEFDVSMFSTDRIKEPYVMDNLYDTIGSLNCLRERYLENKDKEDWDSVIQLLPSSYNQKATWQANYAVLRNIYHARKNHKLDEWVKFCLMIENLPYSELIIE